METIEANGPGPSPYGDKVERIYRVLLSRSLNGPTWYRIAKEADVGYGWAHRVLKGLEGDGIIKGRELKDPRALFARWAARKDRRVYRDYHVQDPAAVLREVKMGYALTGYFAENLVGHYVFPRYHEFYVHGKDATDWHSLLSKKGYVGKGNVQVLLADEHVFFEDSVVEGWPVVSIQQLIVDLYRTGAECAEAAELLVGRAYG
jgi:hypothetical protein